jgi:hypothetical protein
MHKKENKRGLSTIIATLLIILLVLVSVGILWVVVRNVIQTNAEQVSLGKLTLDLSIEKVQISGSNLSVTVKRNSGEGEFVGLSFVVEDEENSEVFTEDVSMNELNVRTFTFTLNQTNPNNIIKIEVVPIFRLKSGREIVGDVKDTWEKTSSGISQCTPNCAGRVCGLDPVCGQSCGNCPTGTCNSTGQCVVSCTPNCAGRVCGPDPICSQSCGNCTTGTCNSTGQCETSIVVIVETITSTSDDAEEVLTTHAMDITSTDLEITYDTFNQYIGMRFQSVNIPQGTIIQSAVLEFECDEASSGAGSVTILGEDIDNAPTFSTGIGNITNRTLTSNFSSWTFGGAWVAQTKYNSSDLKNVIQEIVDRTGWNANSNLVIVINSSLTSKINSRTAEAYEGTAATKLYISY